jgi:hypothetical protein
MLEHDPEDTPRTRELRRNRLFVDGCLHQLDRARLFPLCAQEGKHTATCYILHECLGWVAVVLDRKLSVLFTWAVAERPTEALVAPHICTNQTLRAREATLTTTAALSGPISF